MDPEAYGGRPGKARDALITTAVKATLLADSQLEGLKKDVDTTEGVVSLAGTVSSKRLKKRAEGLAKGTTGAVEVINNLEIAAA